MNYGHRNWQVCPMIVYPSSGGHTAHHGMICSEDKGLSVGGVSRLLVSFRLGLYLRVGCLLEI